MARMGTGDRGIFLRILSTVAKCKRSASFTNQSLFPPKNFPFFAQNKNLFELPNLCGRLRGKIFSCFYQESNHDSSVVQPVVCWQRRLRCWGSNLRHNSDTASYNSTTDCTPSLLCLLTLRFTTARNVWLFFNLVFTLIIDRSQSSVISCRMVQSRHPSSNVGTTTQYFRSLTLDGVKLNSPDINSVFQFSVYFSHSW